MAREISLSGGDISVLKTLGFSGSIMKGNHLIERLGNDVSPAELIDTIEGLLMFDYILASKDRFRTVEDIEKTDFRVNPTMATELREAVSGRSKEPETRRRRRS